MPWGLSSADDAWAANPVHHDRSEFLREKGRHPTHSQGKKLGLSSRAITMTSAPSSATGEVLYSGLSSTLTPLRPCTKKRAEHCQTRKVGGGTCKNSFSSGPQAAGTQRSEPGRAQGLGKEVIRASAGDFDLGSRGRGCSRFGCEAGRRCNEGIVQVHGPNPPPYSTLTSSVSRRGISMEPRDMMRSKGERVSHPPRRSRYSWFLARSEARKSSGSGRDCSSAAPPELGFLLPVRRLNNEQGTASGYFRTPRPLPRKQSSRESLSDRGLLGFR